MFKSVLRLFLSQQTINIFFHLPKAVLANIFYGFPTRRLKVRGVKVIGVTGTDGKTTTVNMIYQILKAAGKKVSMVSTINAYVGGNSYDTGFHVTSPDPFLVQKFAKQVRDNGDGYLVLEVTSHALDQYRFWGIKFDVVVITNITHEHLDYHGIWENYFKTKIKLILDAKKAIVNENLRHNIVRSYTFMSTKLITFGLESGNFNQRDLKLKLRVPGDYNIENALAGLAVAFVLNIDRKIAQKTLEAFSGIKGRMEEVKNDKGIKIIIDFAHTPNGLEQALNSLRSYIQSGKLISIIGCEGARDVGKRAMMGEIGMRLSDIVIVTAVDPRGQMETINSQITQGAKKAGAKMEENYFIIDDRVEAIDFAINNLAKKGDIVGIFGKGHEKSMNLDGRGEIPWSDFEMTEKILSNG